MPPILTSLLGIVAILLIAFLLSTGKRRINLRVVGSAFALQALLAFSRESGRFRGGLSPRAGLALLRAARAWALLHRRTHVLPEDLQAVLPAVVGHRLHPGDDHLEQSAADLVGQLLNAVLLPI